MRRKQKRKAKKMIKINIKNLNIKQIFFWLVVTTIIVNILSLARYKTTIAGSSESSVAVPIISLSSNVFVLENLEPNTTNEYDFYVTTKYNEKITEVAMEYDLELANYSNIPINIQLYECDDSGNIIQECVFNDDNRTNTRTISFGDNDGETHNYKMIIDWNEKDNDYRYNFETEYIEIKLNSSQID